MDNLKKLNYFNSKTVPLQDLNCKFTEEYKRELPVQPFHFTQHPVIASCLACIDL